MPRASPTRWCGRSSGPIAEKAGYRIIGVWENGYREITNNKQPIVKPEDLQGIKLRVPGGVWRVKMFKAYGANPSPMELKEVFVALQTGVMDGQENPLTQIYSQNSRKCRNILSMTGHVYTPAFVTAGASWSRLPADVQKILADTAKEVEPDILKLAAKLDGELIGKMKTVRHPGERSRQAGLRRRQQGDLRGVRQGSPDRQAADRQVAQPRQGFLIAQTAGVPDFTGPARPSRRICAAGAEPSC